MFAPLHRLSERISKKTSYKEPKFLYLCDHLSFHVNYSKTKSDSDSFFLRKLFYSLRSPLFSVQRAILGRFTIFMTISERRWSKIFFIKVMNKKLFLPERASINLSQALNSDRRSDSSWSRFFTFFPFSPTLKMSQICKNLENRVENSEKSRSPKTRKNTPKPLRNGFRLFVSFNCASECKSLSSFHPISHIFSNDLGRKHKVFWNNCLGFHQEFASIFQLVLLCFSANIRVSQALSSHFQPYSKRFQRHSSQELSNTKHLVANYVHSARFMPLLTLLSTLRWSFVYSRDSFNVNSPP